MPDSFPSSKENDMEKDQDRKLIHIARHSDKNKNGPARKKRKLPSSITPSTSASNTMKTLLDSNSNSNKNISRTTTRKVKSKYDRYLREDLYAEFDVPSTSNTITNTASGITTSNNVIGGNKNKKEELKFSIANIVWKKDINVKVFKGDCLCEIHILVETMNPYKLIAEQRKKLLQEQEKEGIKSNIADGNVEEDDKNSIDEKGKPNFIRVRRKIEIVAPRNGILVTKEVKDIKDLEEYFADNIINQDNNEDNRMIDSIENRNKSKLNVVLLESRQIKV